MTLAGVVAWTREAAVEVVRGGWIQDVFGRWSLVLAVRKNKGHVKNESQVCSWRLEKAGMGSLWGGQQLGFG